MLTVNYLNYEKEDGNGPFLKNALVHDNSLKVFVSGSTSSRQRLPTPGPTRLPTTGCRHLISRTDQTLLECLQEGFPSSTTHFSGPRTTTGCWLGTRTENWRLGTKTIKKLFIFGGIVDYGQTLMQYFSHFDNVVVPC